MAFTHRYTLMCDEVRVENNGKLIIIGMYTGSRKRATDVLCELGTNLSDDSDAPPWGIGAVAIFMGTSWDPLVSAGDSCGDTGAGTGSTMRSNPVRRPASDSRPLPKLANA